ncbi:MULTISPECIES: pyridoxamine 5'-phosphate oxidase family protein [Isoptericola]|uniref:Pyridoxamine 5'-phosphate oxidase family protein n=1 Tax=Isoptericola sediminis TaxID=2733572 RepID=A0A849JWJ8_9MICO|nr:MULTISPECIES: pyridoxamine 5'-phosphate oxidase family protein [Isoptericola]MDO8143347.1 pyridoxamine 5'-phosphate oxidase family protein [Isoptericola sp. 178]MDO8147210.1 pyridoxamine 5'-phosphate oxidase family protein [Isoptericola sp. b515]MDO8150477.1 pyridoxamine 5'-phosphate oxidase family protein [Isoptericola sp. b408]NNU26974.1 pyridoxamine 5'-phosphate oxidase family protein [Isoptericola sediminis]
MTDDGTTTTLTPDECWAVLAAQPIGRLATAVAGEPEIFPVSHAVADGHVYFLTRPGSKLVEVTVNNRVAFEADEWRFDTASSVVLKGTAEVLEKDEDIAAAEATELVPYLDDGKNVWVRITPTEMSGRRLTR